MKRHEKQEALRRIAEGLRVKGFGLRVGPLDPEDLAQMSRGEYRLAEDPGDDDQGQRD